MPANPAATVSPHPASQPRPGPGSAASASVTQFAVSRPLFDIAQTRYPLAHED